VSAELKMKCPSCRRSVTEPVARCPHCRLDLHKLDLQFGVAPLRFGPLTDSTLTLSKLRQRRLLRLLHLFQAKFPQSSLSVFLTELPVDTAIGEYTFWLANRARFSTIESTEENNFDLLLAVDRGAGAAGLTVGYGLERQVTEDDLGAALEAGRSAFAARDWAGGIERCIHCLMERMRKISQVAGA
jgi:uncharacterized membrane protein YgcG